MKFGDANDRVAALSGHFRGLVQAAVAEQTAVNVEAKRNSNQVCVFLLRPPVCCLPSDRLFILLLTLPLPLSLSLSLSLSPPLSSHHQLVEDTSGAALQELEVLLEGEDMRSQSLAEQASPVLADSAELQAHYHHLLAYLSRDAPAETVESITALLGPEGLAIEAGPGAQALASLLQLLEAFQISNAAVDGEGGEGGDGESSDVAKLKKDLAKAKSMLRGLKKQRDAATAELEELKKSGGGGSGGGGGVNGGGPAADNGVVGGDVMLLRQKAQEEREAMLLAHANSMAGASEDQRARLELINASALIEANQSNAQAESATRSAKLAAVGQGGEGPASGSALVATKLNALVREKETMRLS